MTQIGTIKGQEIKKNRDGSIAVRLLQVQISNESDMQTVQYMGPAGEDSAPINNDLVQIFSIGPAFKFAVSVEDQGNPAIMDDGEKQLYSRDSNGAIAALINFMANGDLELNGVADNAIRFAALDTQLQLLVTAINTALAGKLDGSGTAGALTLDISSAKIDDVLVP